MHPAFSSNRVALITGGASGIGRAAARRCIEAGMRVAIVDVDAAKLAATAEELAGLAGDAARVSAQNVDVADISAMQALARRIEQLWEPPAVLMNNAAMVMRDGGGGILDAYDTWRNVFDINVFGVINGVVSFLPGMLASGGPPRLVINTGSKQGITLPPGNACYDTAKAAVNAYTQLLAHDLRNRPAAAVSAHLLVPGWTTTGDDTHKPGAWLPDQVIDYLLGALDRGAFFAICPDDETTSDMDRKRILWHALDMVEDRPALSRWHPDYAAAFAAWMKRQLPRF